MLIFIVDQYTIRGQKKSIAQIGLAQYQNQVIHAIYQSINYMLSVLYITVDSLFPSKDGFESSMLGAWQHWRVPICISYNGLFIHEEIETSA